MFTYIFNTDEEDLFKYILLYVCLYSRLVPFMPNFGKQSKPLFLGSGEDPKASDNSFPGLLHYLETTDLTVSQLGMKYQRNRCNSVMARAGLELMNFRLRSEHSYHY
jgi:hypothetical protein